MLKAGEIVFPRKKKINSLSSAKRPASKTNTYKKHHTDWEDCIYIFRNAITILKGYEFEKAEGRCVGGIGRRETKKQNDVITL